MDWQSLLTDVENLLDGPAGERISYLDQAMRLPNLGTMMTAMTLTDVSLARIGYLTAKTDRDFRRAAALLQNGESADRPSERLRIVSPIAMREGGFTVVEADTGSLHLLLEPFGLVEQLLLSRPVTAFSVALTLAQSTAEVRVWLRRHTNERKLAEKQSVTVLKEADGDATVMLKGQVPHQILEINPPKYARSPKEDLVGGFDAVEVPTAYVEVDGKVKAAGRKITHIRNHPDGSQDIIYVEV